VDELPVKVDGVPEISIHCCMMHPPFMMCPIVKNVKPIHRNSSGRQKSEARGSDSSCQPGCLSGNAVGADAAGLVEITPGLEVSAMRRVHNAASTPNAILIWPAWLACLYRGAGNAGADLLENYRLVRF